MASAPAHSPQAQAHLVATAQDPLPERGSGPITLAAVALALRLPVAELTRYFPDGKPGLVTAVLERYLT